MIHKCKVQCHALNSGDIDLLGIKDTGKWLPFAIDLGIINAIKMSTDDVTEPTYKCSTIFTSDGNSFIIDTPYEDLIDAWMEYFSNRWLDDDSTTSSDNDDDIIL